MMPASKHGDPQLGIDIHLCSTPAPTPLPTPHMSVVFDPFDYIPILGATVTVCGMKRATAGTSGIAVHIPPGFPFAPVLPQKDDELFMGSASVVADGDPFSYIALPVLSCQVAGMPSIPRPRKKGPKKMMLGPLAFNLAIPTNVFVGGPPTISLMGMAIKGVFAGLGKLAKSGVFKRMRQKLFKNMNPGFLKCTILRAEPVNILSGAVTVEHEDFLLPGRIPLRWARVYGSDNPHVGQCGQGWETPADARLEIGPAGALMHYAGVGPLSFAGLPVAEGAAAAELELQDGAVLSCDQDEYQVRTKDDRIYHFPRSWLTQAPNGGSVIALGKISDRCGNYLKFERDRGLLTAIQESAGRRLELSHDQGRIVAVALAMPDGSDSHVYVRYAYDAQGDLCAVRDALDHAITFAYDAHHLVRHTDRNGLSFYYEYQTTHDARRVTHAWGDGGLYDYRFEYSDVLRERRITDSLGNVCIVKLNEQGLPINEIDALGGITIYEYDLAGRTVGVTDPDGHRTGYDYDERGNLLELVRPDGKPVSARFDANDKPVAIIDAAGGEWQQTWDERGLLIEQRTPLGHVSRYAYDSHGQLTQFTNARAARTELRFDTLGNLARMQDALGHVTRFGYDWLGNLSGKLDAAGHKTLYSYDRNGRLAGLQLPSGAQVRCTYDRSGNLIRYIDENNAITTLEYTGLGQLARRVQPDGHATEYIYDQEERLVGVRNQRGELYELRRDALGRVTQEIDYWGQPRSYEYSPGSRLLASIDSLDRRTVFDTDPLGRIVRKAFADPYRPEATFEEVFEYDANGNLLAAQNPHCRIERRFDLEGRLLEEKQGDLASVRHAYDEAGNRTLRHTLLRSPGMDVEHQVQYVYDACDQVSQIRIDDRPAIELHRNVLGQIVVEQRSAELRRELDYNADGYLAQQRVRSGGRELFAVGYHYDAAGNLIERRDSSFGVERFVYDPMARVVQHIDPQNRVQHYLSDPAGDLLRTRVAASASADPTAWRRTGMHESTEYRYDRAGNLVQRGDTALSWNASQQLIASCKAGQTTRYHYDAIGRRVAKQTGEHVTRFAWDGDVLLGDVILDRGTVSAAREWVYFPGSAMPLTMLSHQRGASAVLHYINDVNGSPMRLLDEHGEMLWAARMTAWGDIAEVQASRVEQPLGLQGQYRDAETGLCYNLHRYYDSRIGAFVSLDPLGLRAGTSLYSPGPNTLGWADPLGLTCTAITHVDGGYEYFYRAMSKSDFDHFLKTGRIRATTETFISPTRKFSEAYEGVLVKFQVASGTTDALKAMGVRAHGAKSAGLLPDLPVVKRGWGKNKALFKPEGNQVNIGLGKGKALDTFNDSIKGFEILGVN